MIEIDEIGVWTASGAGQNLLFDTSIGGGTVCRNTAIVSSSLSQQTWNVVAKFFVLTAGATGTANMSCELFGNPNLLTNAAGDSGGGPQQVVGNPTIAINTTNANNVLLQMTITGFNTGTSVTEQGMKVISF